MRVVFAVMPTLARRTGIGQYAAELLRGFSGVSCSGRSQETMIDTFPSGRLEQALRWGFRLRDRLSAGDKLAGDCAIPPRWHPRRWVRKATRLGRDAVYRVLKHRFHILSRKYDLYHEPNYFPLPADCRTVVTWHDLSVVLHPEWYPAEFVRRFEGAMPGALARADHFIAVSRFVRDSMIRVLGISPSRVTAIHNGIRSDFQPLSPAAVHRGKSTLRLPPRYLLHVGTIEPRKNLLLLMRAYCDLPAAVRADCPLLLVGKWGWKGEQAAAFLQQTARHKGVMQIGYVPDEFLPVVYNGARALLYPSHYEGFGLPPIEMLACGGAVVTSTAEAFRETLRGQAHQVHPEDQDGWRDAMLRVIRDDDWWRHLRRGASAAADRFSSERCAYATFGLYQRIMESRNVIALVESPVAGKARAA